MENKEHDGCNGCEYERVPTEVYPCNACKQNYTDKYKPAKNKKIKSGDIVIILPFNKRAIVFKVKGKQFHVLCQNMDTYWVGTELVEPTGKTVCIDSLFQ